MRLTTPPDPARSAVMAKVRAKDTGPERAVRALLTAAGYRYRLHRADLPGCPDLVFAGRRRVVFVHGCFWHGHDCPRGARAPRANAAYWAAKIARTRARDAATEGALAALGWRSHVVWECALRAPQAVLAELTAFLGPPGAAAKAFGALTPPARGRSPR